jgi:acetyl esterase/lipase
MRCLIRIVSVWLVFLAATFAATAMAAPISFADLLARPRSAPGQVIRYGPAPDQFGQLWLPAGKGPYPVVVMIHGGCWQASLPGVELMAYIAEDLRQRGIAVWNIEYRRLGAPGGGYPGTFEDVGNGVDRLRAIARQNRLDLRHVVIVGHSAGGHLALWAAARPRFKGRERLFGADPLPVSGVVSLAGIDDLAAYRAGGPDACGGPDTIDGLVGAPARRPPAAYADTSPAAMVPLRVKQAIVSGALDPIVPPRFGEAYAARARAAGDPAQAVTLAGAGHFELIDPTSEAWRHVAPVIQAMLK